MTISYRSAHIRGLKNKTEGSQFEAIFVSQARANGFMLVKMPLGAKRIPAAVGSKLIQIKTPFDYILIKNGKATFVDCKSFDNDHLNYSYLTEHQIETLAAIEEHNCDAGYVVHLRSLHKIYFFHAKDLIKLERYKTLGIDKAICLGSFESFDVSLIKG